MRPLWIYFDDQLWSSKCHCNKVCIHYPGSISPVTLTNDPPRGSFGPSPSKPLGGIPGGPWGAPRIGARGSTIGTAKRKNIYMKTDFEKFAHFVTLTRLKKELKWWKNLVKVHYTNISKFRHVLLFNQRIWIMRLYCQANVSQVGHRYATPRQFLKRQGN